MLILLAGQAQETDFVTILFAAIIMIMERFLMAKVFMMISMTLKMFRIDMFGESMLGEQDGEGQECVQQAAHGPLILGMLYLESSDKKQRGPAPPCSLQKLF